MPQWTLITGASEGLGVEFARLAAKDGHNLILTARSKDKLDALAAQLRSDIVQVEVIPADLSNMAEAERLWAEACQGREINVLVNNAGLGYHGAFDSEQGLERMLSSIQVNVVSLTRLMQLAIPHMKSQPKGRILNVASIAAFSPGPNMAVYNATKAYVVSLSEAVATELAGSSITVSVLCPGVTATNFLDDADMNDVWLANITKPMSAAKVAEAGWIQARKGRRSHVPGVMNKIMAFSTRLSPTRLNAAIAAKMMAKR